jgi:hypothetical protein
MGFPNVHIGPHVASRDFHTLLPLKIQKKGKEKEPYERREERKTDNEKNNRGKRRSI